MNKLWLIFQREFLVRVKKRSFILTTLLTPFAFALLLIVPPMVSKMGDNGMKRLAVLDESGVVMQRDDSGKVIAPIADTQNLTFKPVETALVDLQKSYKKDGFDGIVYVPEMANNDAAIRVQYFSEGQLSMGDKRAIESKIEKKFESKKIRDAGFEEKIIEQFQADVALNQKQIYLDEAGNVVEKDKQNGAEIATAMGFFMAFIIYIILIVYGMQVMRSVMEEKMNRIVEVVISSVKPFQLMLGKILGVSAVGILQLLIWGGLIFGIVLLVPLFFGIDASQTQGMSEMSAAEQETMIDYTNQLIISLSQQNWGFIIPVFLVYFLGGYFIYAALFAAVGSAVGDDLGESQSLTMPIMIPVILSISFMPAVIDNPDGSLAFWLSMIPFFSPIIMPARLPFEPPLWEVLLSGAILIATAFFFIWLAGRIYRVGILMYGKKVTFKELGKWIFYKD